MDKIQTRQVAGKADTKLTALRSSKGCYRHHEDQLEASQLSTDKTGSG